MGGQVSPVHADARTDAQIWPFAASAQSSSSSSGGGGGAAAAGSSGGATAAGSGSGGGSSSSSSTPAWRCLRSAADMMHRWTQPQPTGTTGDYRNVHRGRMVRRRTLRLRHHRRRCAATAVRGGGWPKRLQRAPPASPWVCVLPSAGGQSTTWCSCLSVASSYMSAATSST
jgi:hypothetical protein